MKVLFKTLGCRLNQAETDQISDQLALAGYLIIDQKTEPDLIIINTCSVTNKADRKSRQAIHTLQNRFPQAKIIVTGCAKLRPMEGEYYADKKKLPQYLCQKYPPQTQNEKISPPAKSKAFIKIQTGCDNFCAYCIIPFLRGKSQSETPKDVISQINQKLTQGYDEIVLTGINIGKYQSGGATLSKLVAQILEKTRIERLSLSSINPEDLTDDLILQFQDHRLCRQLHLSLQSGSPNIVRRMGRGYSLEQYERVVRQIKLLYPKFKFTTDLIVGFPGETERDFANSYHFCQKIGFAKIHVFPYSPRKGTPAATMPNQIPVQIKKDRATAIKRLNSYLQTKTLK